MGRAPGTLLDSLDPIVGLADDVIPSHAGFGMHPHRGIEIVTYLWQGGLRHEDSQGNSAVLEAGGAERVFTGRGIAHAELPTGPADTLGLQLWLALSPAEQGETPEFQEVRPVDLPAVEVGAARLWVVAGVVDGRASPLRTRRPLLYLDVTLAPGGEFLHPVPTEYAGLLYVLSGKGNFGEPPRSAGPRQRLVLGPGDAFPAQAGTGGLRFVLAAGQPHREEPAWNGSFVD